MDIHIITLFPEIFTSLTQYGVLGRALEARKLQIKCWNPRDFTQDPHRTVDDRPYGGGPGMVMLAEPLYQAITTARATVSDTTRCVYLTPAGQLLGQETVQHWSQESSLILVCGRYEGIDERLIGGNQFDPQRNDDDGVSSVVDEEWSVGDYVVSGGEFPALLVIDAVARCLPGVLGHPQSASEDSFADNGILDWPQYTRPSQWRGKNVPAELLQGDHHQIQSWRLKQALARTQERRPELLKKRGLSSSEEELLKEYHQSLEKKNS